jgi:Dyp-type peroxidase family
MNEVDYTDVQGLVRFGYKRMTKASYALVRVKDAAAARAWLRTAPVTSAVAMDPSPKSALHVAFTVSGLRALGVSESVIAGFSHEFRDGMVQEYRSRQLGDVEANDPKWWDWGGPASEPHLVVMFFAEPDSFDAALQSCTGTAWTAAFEVLRFLETSDLDGIEPFGVSDGISQPQIDWKQQRATARAEFDYTNVVALGEFLLGYPNEYGKITDRPLVDADAASAELVPAIESPEKKDLGRNGTYLVMRQLDQDVRKFWQFVHEQSGGNRTEAEKLTASMVGRTREGEPLVPLQNAANPGVDQSPEQIRQNQFTFDSDPAGSRCPFGAHIRRANPRNADFPAGLPRGLLKKLITMLGFGPRGFRDDLMSSVRFHRILRRGREYGRELKPEDALGPAPPDDPPRGLHFICLNANISRQFEFLQNAWIASTKFSGLTGESDPLLGNRQTIPGCPATSGFTIPTDGRLPRRITGLPQFVTVRGGAYFFLPSLRAIRYFGGVGD